MHGRHDACLLAAAALTALACLPSPAWALCLNPFGCAPSTYDQCMAEATKRPTELGVKVARQECHNRFVVPARRARMEKLSSAWPRVGKDLDTLRAVTKEIGEADEVRGPRPCTDPSEEEMARSGGKPPMCILYEWDDESKPPRYTSWPTIERLPPARFKLEVETNDSSRAVRMWWKESF